MSDQSDAAGSDDFSGLTGFFFYAFLVHPITAWILRPGRFERKKSIMYAIAFLAALAAIKTGLEMQQRGPNYYEMLGVTRSSSPLEIKRAYKKLSLQLHPDKNPSPDASDQFDAVKQAHDALMDLEFREVYNKFGAEGIKQNKRFSESQFLLEAAIYYVSYGMMAFMLTMGKSSGQARNWIFTGLIVMAVCEVVVMTSPENPFPAWLMPQTTEYDFIWLLKSLFPAFLNGCRSMGSYLYVDLDAQTRALLLALQEQNKDILLVLRDIQIGVQTVQTHGVGGGGGSTQRLATDGTTAPAPPGAMARATPTGKLKELQDRLKTSNSNVASAVQQLQNDGRGNSNYGFYLMILGYIVVSYIFN
mmetsp:Transcript_24245/g.67222  ORF Transcript_24245/g.67222 Transcript_24245/m.67222 type:complete len:360 (-) Transcript_24245:1926-3005(-)|eukprot:CAMPEP_0168747422 /NCGR_PEP_ID=MMETSP0724-20121128/15650_1 /TAXON_ID=265536 /ORGANISM="Amphiprora sp., Strain CCMP467" /LENGTH=359 /DNA_ID=CAMNT_0008795215 /DNA_START=36 /DNA_END=1115 /DNA_ORIENTATION=-